MTIITHHYQDLIDLFNHCFLDKYRTQLSKGDDEPIYLPANEGCVLHTIFFAHGFFSSALHECAHWFIAGKGRRQKVDYGYWYEPGNRTMAQQEQFQRVEVKPQAIEWILSAAADFRFHFSLDNLNADPGESKAFQAAVYQQVALYHQEGLPRRAETFRQELCRFYGTRNSWDLDSFINPLRV